jgi:hypothetical protein
MNLGNDKSPRVVESVNDMSWFHSVLDSSRQTLESTPDDGKPSWYRNYEAGEESSK